MGGDYDPLFIATPPASIAFIYKSLGCRHSLQPAVADDDFSTPSVPALKPKGFVTWQTIQILLGPEEHVPFIQSALRQFDIKDPRNGSSFPKLLPAECFPEKPDSQMTAWYEAVSERLMREAQMEQERYMRERERFTRPDNPQFNNHLPDMAGKRASYDPIPKRKAYERRHSKEKTNKIWPPLDFVEEKGRFVASTVKHFWDAHPMSRQGSSSDYIKDDAQARHRRNASHSPRGRTKSSRTGRRSRSSSTCSSDNEGDFKHNKPRSRDPPPRRHRSHDPLPSVRYNSTLHPSEARRPYNHRSTGSRNSSLGQAGHDASERAGQTVHPHPHTQQARPVPDLDQARRDTMPHIPNYYRQSMPLRTEENVNSGYPGHGRRVSPSTGGQTALPSDEKRPPMGFRYSMSPSNPNRYSTKSP